MERARFQVVTGLVCGEIFAEKSDGVVKGADRRIHGLIVIARHSRCASAGEPFSSCLP